ncbi:MAG: HAD family hydrolase [Verrucomicrobiota bacterium]|nr:HAD family hydrolase [Verrucomicrobiota bacterium]
MIIFDLDDTLIDTTGCVTPYKLQAALAIMGAPGGAALEELKTINETSARTQDALREFAHRHHVPKELLHAALAELTAPLPPDFQVICTPNAKEILNYYKSRYSVALVTGGHPPFQREKLKKAGIEEAIFSMIAVPEDSVKKPFYKAIAAELSKDPTDVWVCGDRIPMDLLPAHELGFHTVHMRWGRGQKMGREPWVEHSITNLSELRKIVA